MVALVNSHTNSTRIGWHLWDIDLRFAPGLPPGRLCEREKPDPRRHEQEKVVEQPHLDIPVAMQDLAERESSLLTTYWSESTMSS